MNKRDKLILLFILIALALAIISTITPEIKNRITGKVSGMDDCGDKICNREKENCEICPTDCGACCGNKICEPEFGEDATNCETDCICDETTTDGDCEKPDDPHTETGESGSTSSSSGRIASKEEFENSAEIIILDYSTNEETTTVELGEDGGNIAFMVDLRDDSGSTLGYDFDIRIRDPEGNEIYKEEDAITNDRINVPLRSNSDLGYYNIDTGEKDVTKHVLVIEDQKLKDDRSKINKIITNAQIIQDGFKKLPEDKAIADTLLQLKKGEASILSILNPLNPGRNIDFSPLKSSEIEIEKIELRKSPARIFKDEVIVGFTIKEPEKEKEDELLLKIKDNKPYINFNFKF